MLASSDHLLTEGGAEVSVLPANRFDYNVASDIILAADHKTNIKHNGKIDIPKASIGADFLGKFGLLIDHQGDVALF
ncbi:hypothetical protein GQX74_005651 [Glossina fuscipes]|nr:hypothetical protein GQX74_005651 [Glossina fuscipes]